ncbi:MAG: glycerophosphodiester phosphodiesterase family protein [Acidimicrobiales bacterium]
MNLTHRTRIRTLVLGLVAGLLAAVVPGSPTSAEPVEQPIAAVMVIAHRGASFYLPEHTFPAYDLAIEMDADMLECDIQLTADEQLVCVHDATLNRTARDGVTGAPVTGRVDSYTLAQLREMEWGSWRGEEYFGLQVVPLAEQLLCYRAINPTMKFHLETKFADLYGGVMEERLVELLDRVGYIPEGDADAANGLIIIQSFFPASLERSKALAPSLPTAVLGNAGYFAPGQLVPDYIDAVSPGNALIRNNPDFIARMHAQGRVVHTYTVNDAAVMDQLLDLGIDGIFTDRPDVLRERVDLRGTGVPAEERGNPADFERGCPGVAGTINSIDDVPVTPTVDFEAPRPVIQPGSTVPTRFTLDLRGGDYADGVSVEVIRPDGSRVEAQMAGAPRGGHQALVRTERSLPGDYQVVVLDSVGFEIGRTTLTTR